MPRKLPPTAFDFKAARTARKYSQQKAAALLHATQPSISRWEADGTMPEIYKMAWLLYWQLEDIKYGSKGASRSRKSSDAGKRSATTGGTQTRKDRSRNRSRQIVSSTKRADESRTGMEEGTTEVFQSTASDK